MDAVQHGQGGLRRQGQKKDDGTSFLVPLLVTLARHTFLGRGRFRRAILQFFKKNLRLRSVESRIFGKHVRLHLDNTCEAKFLLAPYTFNSKEFAFIERMMPSEGGHFVDIGANAGIYGFKAASLAKARCRILCVEPNPRMVERMKNNLLREDLYDETALSIEYAECAVGLENEEGHLDLAGGLGTARLGQAGSRTLPVPVRRLDTLMREYGFQEIDVLKIDIEGHEDKALAPLMIRPKQALWPRGLIIEHCEADRWGFDVLARLKDVGYEVVDRSRNNTMLAWKNDRPQKKGGQSRR